MSASTSTNPTSTATSDGAAELVTTASADLSVQEHLVDVEQTARDELRRADTKAGMLLSLATGSLVAVIALTARHTATAAAVALWLAAAGLAVAIVGLLLTVRPNLGARHGLHAVRGSWIHAAVGGPQELIEALAGTATERTTAHAEHVCVLARLARRKLRTIRTVVHLLVVDLAVLAAGFLLTLGR